MGQSHAQSAWQYLQPEAQVSTETAIQPRLDAIDLKLKAHIEDLQDQVNIAKARILDLEDEVATKAPLNHTHSIGQITNLTNALTQLQTRVTSLETRVTALEGA